MISEALTLARNFGPWFAGVGVVSLLLGGGLASCVTNKINDGRVQRAERALVEYKLEVSTAINEAAAKAEAAGRVAVENLQNDRQKLDAIGNDIRAIRRDVRVCNSLSGLQDSVAAIGVGSEAANGQLRDAVEVLQDLAAQSAERADANASQLNRLIEWLEEARK